MLVLAPPCLIQLGLEIRFTEKPSIIVHLYNPSLMPKCHGSRPSPKYRPGFPYLLSLPSSLCWCDHPNPGARSRSAATPACMIAAEGFRTLDMLGSLRRGGDLFPSSQGRLLFIAPCLTMASVVWNPGGISKPWRRRDFVSGSKCMRKELRARVLSP